MSLYYQDDQTVLHHGDAASVLATLPDGAVDCIVTSPPYLGLRDYGVDGQIGAESSPAEFASALVAVFREARRVLADDGCLFLNLGDSYAGGGASGPPSSSSTLRGNGHVGGGPKQQAGAGRPSRNRDRAPVSVPSRLAGGGIPAKNLLGIPWRVAFALQDDGWILRNDIIWSKPNAMPESVADRLSSRHEHVFMLTKSPRYWFDLDPIREPHTSTPDRAGANALRGQSAIRPTGPNSGAYSVGGRNPGDVWSVATQPFSEAHFATMPPALAERCVQAGCKHHGTVLDPFSGSGTTGYAAAKHGRSYIGIDLNADYLALSLRTRLAQPSIPFGGIA